MHPGRFVGFAWNFGSPMTFKVLQCNTDLHKYNMLVHRGVVVPCNLEATGYNFYLEPKSDAYYPEVYLEGAPPSITTIPGQQGTVDTPDISI